MGVEVLPDDEHFDGIVSNPNPLVAIVSSRIGHDVQRHRSLSQQMAASLQRMRHAGETLLVAEGTAVEPWVTHAADVFQIPTIRISELADRDRLVIALADRVDAVYVRRGGKVTSLLQQRAQLGGELGSGLVRVAIDASGRERGAVMELLDAGAVGRYLPAEPDRTQRFTDDLTATAPAVATVGAIDWSRYLVHCTRAAAGPWPGQSWNGYCDDMLLGDPSLGSRDCIDALCRIVRKERLVAGAITSNRSTPVVCFSAVPLPELIARRAYRSHLHRWDYEPYGIAITRDAAARLGIAPVVYGDRETRQQLPDEQKYRFQSSGTNLDWASEREWRSCSDVNLSVFGAGELCVFVPDDDAAMRVASVVQGRWPVTVLARDTT